MTIGMRMRSPSISRIRASSSARSGEPGAYDLMGSFTGRGGVKIPEALMLAIVESMGVRVERTRYEVAGWGVGELWTKGGVVVAHEFDFGGPSSSRPLDGGALPESDGLEPAGLVRCVRAFLAGEDVPLAKVPLDLDWCTEFQRAVLTVLRELPRGDVVSYGELAALAGRPGAQRAVGSICAGNRFAFFVPCHRVVAAHDIGGYGSAGVAVKRRLLDL